MFKKIIFLLVLCGFPLLGQTQSELDSNKAVQQFSKNLEQIKLSLKDGKMSDRQAMILLLAIQSRQNQVLIQQNAEIIVLLKSRGAS